MGTLHHRRDEHVVGAIHTNTIEGYVNEFEFRYNNRMNSDIFGAAIRAFLNEMHSCNTWPFGNYLFIGHWTCGKRLFQFSQANSRYQSRRDKQSCREKTRPKRAI